MGGPWSSNRVSTTLIARERKSKDGPRAHLVDLRHNAHAVHNVLETLKEVTRKGMQTIREVVSEGSPVPSSTAASNSSQFTFDSVYRNSKAKGMWLSPWASDLRLREPTI
jgi:hypothetical protein